MSYESESILPAKVTLAQVQEIIALLGYKRTEDGQSVTDCVGSYFWYQEDDYRSYVGFNNAIIKANVYLESRNFKGTIAKETPSGLDFMDELNPRLLSNNLLLPYVIAIWEDYFRSTFAAALKYSKGKEREVALKKARLNHGHLEQARVATDREGDRRKLYLSKTKCHRRKLSPTSSEARFGS